MELTHRTTAKVWNDCLEPRHRPNVALRQETKPFYRCNITKALVRVAITFVSYRGSHAFRNIVPGMVQHTKTREWREPVPVERERAMGFPEGYTQVVGISDTQRREMLGRVMDPHTLQFMIQVCKYMAPIADSFCMPSTYAPTCQNLGGTGVASGTDLSSKANVLSPPLFKRARTGTAGSEERTPDGESVGRVAVT